MDYVYVEWVMAALLMRAGLALHSVGSVRAKNAGSAMGRQLLDWAIAILAFFSFGAAIAFQSNSPFIGFNSALAFGRSEDVSLFTALARVSLVGGIIMAATAERAKIRPMLILSMVTAGVTLPIVISWNNYGGWLAELHFYGHGSFYIVGAVTALVATIAIGPRDGKYHRDGSTSYIPGHNLTFGTLGTLLFVGGAMILAGVSSNVGDGSVVLNVVLAAAASVLMSALTCQVRFSKIDLPILACSLMGGVVAMTSSSHYASGGAAVAIGAVAGWLVTFGLIRFDLTLKLDDVSGPIATFGLASAWGILAAIPFRETAWADRLKAWSIQGAGLAAIILISVVISAIVLTVLRLFGRLRVTDTDEFDGLDLAEHDVSAYPDFQQTTIKSYHLRER